MASRQVGLGVGDGGTGPYIGPGGGDGMADSGEVMEVREVSQVEERGW